MTYNNNTYSVSLDILKQKESKSVKTGFAEFDEKTDGIEPSALTLIASRPLIGKTAVALHIAKHIAIEQNMPVLYFSPERTKEVLTQHFIHILTGLNTSNFNSTAFTDDEQNRINKATELLSNAPIYIDDTIGISPEEICSKYNEFKEKPALVIIDSLQHMNVDKKEKKIRHEMIKVESKTLNIIKKRNIMIKNKSLKIERKLWKIAHKMNIPIVALSSVSRACEGRINKRPKLSDINGLDKYADRIYVLYNEGCYSGKLTNQTEIIKVKGNGKSGVVVEHLNIN